MKLLTSNILWTSFYIMDKADVIHRILLQKIPFPILVG